MANLDNLRLACRKSAFIVTTLLAFSGCSIHHRPVSTIPVRHKSNDLYIPLDKCLHVDVKSFTKVCESIQGKPGYAVCDRVVVKVDCLSVKPE